MRKLRTFFLIQGIFVISFTVHFVLHTSLPFHQEIAQLRRRTAQITPDTVLDNASIVPVKLNLTESASNVQTTIASETSKINYDVHIVPFNGVPKVDWETISNSSQRMEDSDCEDDFGFGLVRRWKAAKSVWCAPMISCHPLMQRGHGGNGDNICIIENATFDPSPFRDSVQTQASIQRYKDSVHSDMPYLRFNTPVLHTKCEKKETWRDEQLPGWNLDWMSGGLATDRPQDCSSADNRVLLIIQRDTFANFFHDSEDFYNSFLALQIAGIKPDEVTVLLADLFPWGPFEALWKRLFPRVLTAWEYRETPPRCYRKVVVGIFGPASPLTLISTATPCVGSPLVRAYARWAWASFGLAPRPAEGRTRLLWMSRKPSVLWPERAYCDGRYFRCEDWLHLEVRTLGRVLQNEEEVVAGLSARGGGLEVRNLDFNKVGFERQMEEVVGSDALAGPHGAGLTHLLFLPDWACVFEVFIDGAEANIHYANMAKWRGLKYQSFVSTNPASVVDVVSNFASCMM